MSGTCPRCGERWTDHGGVEEPICRVTVIGVDCMNAFHEFCAVGRCDCRCHVEVDS